MDTRPLRVLATALALAATLAPAQEAPKPARPVAAERAATLGSLERGKRLKGSRDTYQHLPQVFAVALADASETPEQALARVGENGAQIVETKGRLVLFRSARSKGALAQVPRVGGVLPTALNARTGALGVLTGNLIVKPKSMADADAIAAGHDLEKTKAYPQLQTVFYRAKAGVDIADVSAALQADPRVEHAYPEIVERVRAPR